MPPPAGTPCRPHEEPSAQRAGRVKAAAALRAVARSASLDAARPMSDLAAERTQLLIRSQLLPAQGRNRDALIVLLSGVSRFLEPRVDSLQVRHDGLQPQPRDRIAALRSGDGSRAFVSRVFVPVRRRYNKPRGFFYVIYSMSRDGHSADPADRGGNGS